jgi:hypothetical protein
MDWSMTLNLVNTAAVTLGVLFGGYQLLELRRQRRRDSILNLVRSFQSADFTAALGRVNTLPDGARLKDIRRTLGPTGRDQVFLIGLTWESLGVLAARGEVDLDTIDDFFRGAIVISWRKLRVFVEEDRRELERDTVWEWFQWLAERIAEREQRHRPVPAHLSRR